MISISGKVITGDKFGRQLGFPTANLDRRQYVTKKMEVTFGVYGGFTILPTGKKFISAIVIGPLDKKGLPKLEAHLINFKGNLYGQKITVILAKYLRAFKKFKDLQTLKKQIANDIKLIKKIKF